MKLTTLLINLSIYLFSSVPTSSTFIQYVPDIMIHWLLQSILPLSWSSLYLPNSFFLDDVLLVSSVLEILSTHKHPVTKGIYFVGFTYLCLCRFLRLNFAPGKMGRKQQSSLHLLIKLWICAPGTESEQNLKFA